MKNKSFYLITLFLFKAAVGSILLLVGWDIIGFSKDSSYNVSLITGLAFLPAAFAKPLYNKLSHLSDSFVASTSLIVSSTLVIFEWLYLNSNIKNIYLFAIIHFILWIFIFLIETFLERWFVSINESSSDIDIKNLSGLSMGLIQIGVISGPIIVWLTKFISFSAPYISTSILLILSAIPGILIKKNNHKNIFINSDKKSTSFSILKPKNLNQIKLILSFALIWPTVATFNMMVPILVKSFLNETIFAAVILEIALALGTGCIGFLMSKTKLDFLTLQRSIVLLFLFVLIFITETKNFTILSIATFAIGLFYGHLRILSRTYLAKKFKSESAGHIISTSNAISAPFVVIYLTIGYLEFNYFQTIILSGLAFLISGLFFFFVQKGSQNV